MTKYQVNNVEAIILILPLVSHPEVEPLSEPTGIQIVLEDQVEFMFIYLSYTPNYLENGEQVHRFVITIKLEFPTTHRYFRLWSWFLGHI